MEELLPIVESFHSLQGEGAHAGSSAFFIRLARCKVGCSWCDTKESWIENVHPKESIQTIAINTAKAQNAGASFVVLTGGEPLHHNLNSLCESIREITFAKSQKVLPIHLETSGVDELSGSPDWITLSPKRHFPPRADLLKACHELKVVIHTHEDLLFAESMATKANKDSSQKKLFFLQAVWNDHNAQKIALAYVKQNPKWRLSMQTHKWLNVR
tara:strand:+ start:125 stop:766 length:642 start_codon:yes stop_codon:yes gene_type:complete